MLVVLNDKTKGTQTMTSKRLAILTLVFAMMAMMAGAVISAQDGSEDGKRGGRHGFGGQSEIVNDATGLTREEIHTAIEDGSTVADLITANGGDVDSVIAELVAEATTHINEKVAEGRITQEQADERLAELESNITARLDGTLERPERPEGEGRRGRGGRDGQGFDYGFGGTGDTSDDA